MGQCFECPFETSSLIVNKILRIINFTYRSLDKDQLYYNIGILPVTILVNHRIDLLMQKLTIFYTFNQNDHHHFTRLAHHFHSMRGNNEFVYRTFVLQSVFILNKSMHNLNINVLYARFKQ